MCHKEHPPIKERLQDFTAPRQRATWHSSFTAHTEANQTTLAKETVPYTATKGNELADGVLGKPHNTY